MPDLFRVNNVIANVEAPPDALHVIQHSAVATALSMIRSRATSMMEFRSSVRSIARALAYEATRSLPLERIEIETPMEPTEGARLATRVVAVPILRAGLGMLDGFLDIVPDAATGFIGLRRDEATLQPVEYYRKVPSIDSASLFLLDPMLATGGSVLAALRQLPLGHSAGVTVLSIIAAPEGVGAVSSEFPGVTIYTASLDRCLNERGYILPGLGDAGDRLCDAL